MPNNPSRSFYEGSCPMDLPINTTKARIEAKYYRVDLEPILVSSVVKMSKITNLVRKIQGYTPHRDGNFQIELLPCLHAHT